MLIILKVLTVALIMWQRVEYQSCRYTPWVVLGRGTPKKGVKSTNDARHTIHLDYPSMFLPLAVYRAISNRHYLPAAAMVVSLLLRLQIVIGVNLFSLQPVEITRENVPVKFLNEFNDSYSMPDRIYNIATIKRTNVVVLEAARLKLPYPDGMVSGQAFQTFDSESIFSFYKPSSLALPVKGIATTLECETAEIRLKRQTAPEIIYASIISHYNITFNYILALNNNNKPQAHWNLGFAEAGSGPFYTTGSRPSPSNQSAPIPLLVAGLVYTDGTANQSLNSMESSSVICRFGFVSNELHVIQNSPSMKPVVELSRQPGFNRTIEGPTLTLLYNCLGYPERGTMASYSTFTNKDSTLQGDVISGLDTPWQIGFSLWPSGPPSVRELLDTSNLKNFTKLSFAEFGSWVAHLHLRSKSSNNVPGSITVTELRLLVQTSNAYIMTTIFGIITLMTAPLFLLTAPKDGFVPRRPDSLIAIAVLLSKSRSVLESLKGTGRESLERVKPLLGGSYYTTVATRQEAPLYPLFKLIRVGEAPEEEAGRKTSHRPREWYNPWCLHIIAQVVLGLLATLGAIVCLCVLFHNSVVHQGIAGVNDPTTDQRYLWTSLPTLIFALLSMYIGACDSEVRSLAVFEMLKTRQEDISGAIGTTFTDELGVRTLFKAYKARCVPVCVSKSLAILAGFLTIASSELFKISVTDRVEGARVQDQTWFASIEDDSESFFNYYPDDRGHAGSCTMANMILNENFNYPQWTYGTLAFPEIAALPDTNLSQLPNMTLSTVITAVTTSLDCKFRSWANSSDLCLTSTGEYTGLYGSVLTGDGSWLTTPLTHKWGVCGPNPYQAQLICQEQFQNVDVHTTFINSDFEISTETPPQPDNSTYRSLNLSIFEPLLYAWLAPHNMLPDRIDGFFGTLINSSTGIPDYYLKSDTHAEEAINAIKKQHGIIRAQTISGGNGTRPGYLSSETSGQRPAQPAPRIAELRYTELRVVQNASQTIALVTLLGVILILQVSLLVLTRRRGYGELVSKPPGSIAALASLLADSNIFEALPDQAQWMSDRKLAISLRARKFRMGWFALGHSGEGRRVWTIGVVNDTEATTNHQGG